jgi:predicted DCC family thiol-disulfide oxidoreductase YuxK
MVHSAAQSPPDSTGVHLVLYDGICGLCDRLVQFILHQDRHGVFRFAALQSNTGRAIVERNGGNPDQLTSFYVIANYDTASPRVLRRSDAALFVAGALGWPWRAAGLMRWVPAAIRDRAYDALGRRRYLVFGRYDRCLLPRPEFRNRFID